MSDTNSSPFAATTALETLVPSEEDFTVTTMAPAPSALTPSQVADYAARLVRSAAQGNAEARALLNATGASGAGDPALRSNIASLLGAPTSLPAPAPATGALDTLSRAYTPPARGSFDPLTASISGNIPSFFSYRPRLTPPPPTSEGGGGDGGDGDIRLPPARFVPNARGQRTISGPAGGTYVQNPDAAPFMPSTGSISRDLANIANIPGLTGAVNSVLTGGPLGALSVLGGTALSSLGSDPRVTTITGGLGDLYREAQRTPEERAAVQETRRDLDAMTDRDIMDRYGITLEDLPALQNIAATYGPEGSYEPGTPATPGAPGTGNFAQDLSSFLSEPAVQDAALSFGLGALTGGIGPGIAAASRGAMSGALADTLADMLGIEKSVPTVTDVIGSMFGISGNDKGIGDVNESTFSGDKDTSGIGGEKGDAAAAAAADAAAAAAAANADADSQPGGVNDGGGGAPGGAPSGDAPGGEASTSGGDMGGGPSGDSGDGYKEGGLVRFAKGGLIPLAGGGKIAVGPGGGLDDLIPTSINGRRAAALSDGEFVIPSDVVSMMGDGSSNAGARRLYDLMRQVRDAKTGTTRQAGPLPVGEILKRSLGR